MYFVHLSLLSGLSHLSPVINGWVSTLLWLQLDVPLKLLIQTKPPPVKLLHLKDVLLNLILKW